MALSSYTKYIRTYLRTLRKEWLNTRFPGSLVPSVYRGLRGVQREDKTILIVQRLE